MTIIFKHQQKLYDVKKGGGRGGAPSVYTFRKCSGNLHGNGTCMRLMTVKPKSSRTKYRLLKFRDKQRNINIHYYITILLEGFDL